MPLKHATVGLMVAGNPLQNDLTLFLKNSKIYNSASVNLWAKTASVTGENVVLGGAGAISLYCNLGGDYSFTRTTIANYGTNGFRDGEALRLDNEILLTSGETVQGDLVNAVFTNTIIDGNGFTELALSDNDTNAFNFSFINCLIQFNETTENPLYDFENPVLYRNLLPNADAAFKDAIKNDFRIGAESGVLGKGALDAALQVPFDILGKERTPRPDIGAFQYHPVD